MPTVAAERLVAFTNRIVAAMGSRPEEAREVAEHLVGANLAGHDSHGVGMIPTYVRILKAGLLVPNQELRTVGDAGALLVLDAGRGFGQAMAAEAMRRGIARARELGACVVALRHSAHIGRIGAYGEQCAAAGMASVHFVNVADHQAWQAPYGCGDARLGTNPFCAAVPGAEGDAALVLDMATSAIAFGKARVARNKGVPVPEGVLLDGEGRPTTDPRQLVDEHKGALVAFGGHKGSGLAVMCEILGAALIGGQTIVHEKRNGVVNNMLSFVVDASRFGPADAIRREIEAVKAWIKAAPPAPGFSEILLPGDPENRARAAARRGRPRRRADLRGDRARRHRGGAVARRARAPRRGLRPMERIDCVVVGVGVVGLAVARRLALAGREVIVLERADMIGTETSSRNSEVIHAGIYYPKGSLKARACIAGKWFLYRYCDLKGVAYNRCGKLIVATSETQNATLETIKANALALGMPDLELWPAGRAMELEPNLRCTAALWSPTTGVIDSHGLMLAYQGDAEAHGAMIAFESPLERAAVREDGIELEVGGAEPMRLLAGILVNSAGLHAPDLARRIAGLDPGKLPRAYYCKGNYYTLSGKSPFARLIYPVPEQAGLGVHVTVDLGGQCRFGPDVEWVDRLDYDVDPRRAELFYEAVRKYWPGLEDGALEPGYAGIRPKIVPKGAPAADFVVQGPADHGVPGLVNLFGIESPGLTASWPLAREVARKLGLPELEDELEG